MKPSTAILALTLSLALPVAGSSADLAENVYDASSGELPDVQCDNWDEINSGGLEAVLEGGKLVLATDTNPKNLGYIQSSPAVASPEVLVVSFRMQFVSGTSSADSRGPVNIGFTIGETNRKNVLQIEDGTVFLLSGDNTRGPEAEVATSDAVHAYRMEVTTATGEIDLYYDDALVLEGGTFPDSNVMAPRVFWGETSILARGESHWESFSHNASTKPRSSSNATCGDPISDLEPVSASFRTIVAGDALFALKAAVGSACCALCACDVNDSGDVKVGDALQILRTAVGQEVELACPPCLLASP